MSSSDTKLVSTFSKVTRRGKLVDRRVSIDVAKKQIVYHRYRKIFTFQRKSFYSIQDVTDLREGWMTTKFKKVEEKVRRLWMNGKQEEANKLAREECSFSIVFSTDKTIDLIATDSNVRLKWLNELKAIIFEIVTAKKTRDRLAFLEKCFKEADKDGDRFINFIEAMNIIKRFNISINDELARNLFQKSIVAKKTIKGEDVLDIDEFSNFFGNLEHRSEVKKLFCQYAEPEGTIMGSNELQRFFHVEQSMEITLSTCQKYIEKFQTNSTQISSSTQALEPTINLKGFEALLLSPEFDLFNHEHHRINHDMNRPLNHYYILSSHNTYLLAGQLVGQSSIEGYIDAMRRGYRCVELDIWDGDADDGPIIYHGYTMVTKLLLKDVLEAIATYAFDTTPYPLILSLEVHCSSEQQKSVAALLVAILGDKLYKGPLEPTDNQLPSPENLQNKILIKASGQRSKEKDDSSSLSSSDSDEELDEFHGQHSISADNQISIPLKEKIKPKLITNLAELAVYCSARKFHSLEDTFSWNFNEMFSLKESKSANLANLYADEYTSCTAKRLVRIYPKGSRFDSSNYDPVIHWNVGCQMVALNVQTSGKHLLVNEARFASNGHCGYTLKPDHLMEMPTEKGGITIKPLQLELTIISGQQLRKQDSSPEYDKVDPYVKISVIGHPEDQQKMTSRVIPNNGFNPIWSETFVFTLKYPELAFLYFKVKDERSSGKESKLAGNVIVVSSIKSGYRHLQLMDNRGKKIDGCTLFMKVTMV